MAAGGILRWCRGRKGLQARSPPVSLDANHGTVVNAVVSAWWRWRWCLVQVGTVKEGLGEFFSARLTKKERKRTLVDEMLVADEKVRCVGVASREGRGGDRGRRSRYVVCPSCWLFCLCCGA